MSSVNVGELIRSGEWKVQEVAQQEVMRRGNMNTQQGRDRKEKYAGGGMESKICVCGSEENKKRGIIRDKGFTEKEENEQVEEKQKKKKWKNKND